MPSSRRTFENFFKIPFSYRLKAFFFFSFRELPSDQENKNGLAAKLLWFLGHRVASMTFRHLNFVQPGRVLQTLSALQSENVLKFLQNSSVFLIV